jgi:hypothetical protein
MMQVDSNASIVIALLGLGAEMACEIEQSKVLDGAQGNVKSQDARRSQTALVTCAVVALPPRSPVCSDLSEVTASTARMTR